MNHIPNSDNLCNTKLFSKSKRGNKENMTEVNADRKCFLYFKYETDKYYQCIQEIN